MSDNSTLSAALAHRDKRHALKRQLAALAITEAEAQARGLEWFAGPYYDPQELLATIRQLGGAAKSGAEVVIDSAGTFRIWKPGHTRRNYNSEFRAAMRENAHVGPKVSRPKDFARGSDGRKHARG